MPDLTISGFADELERRLREADQKSARIKSEMERLGQERGRALAAGDTSLSVRLKRQLAEQQDALEDLKITKAAIEGKLRVYTQNASEAAKLRDQANAFWEEGRALVEEFAKMQARARVLYQKALELEGKISELGREHFRLVGRDMTDLRPDCPKYYTSRDLCTNGRVAKVLGRDSCVPHCVAHPCFLLSARKWCVVRCVLQPGFLCAGLDLQALPQAMAQTGEFSDVRAVLVSLVTRHRTRRGR
jgi:hypothetical protein